MCPFKDWIYHVLYLKVQPLPHSKHSLEGNNAVCSQKCTKHINALYKRSVDFKTLVQNCEKLLLVLSCMFFRPSVCLSVYLSVLMEQLGSHWTDFHDI